MRPCPCGLPETYGSCCSPLHRGAPAPTAERLMRSRFSAFVLGDADHLLRTWDPDTRPAELTLDPDLRWTRLEIIDRTGGELLAREGTVEFRAHYTAGGRPGAMHERSHFRRGPEGWLYVGAHPSTG